MANPILVRIVQSVLHRLFHLRAIAKSVACHLSRGLLGS